MFEFSFLPALTFPFFLINAPLLAIVVFAFLYDFRKGIFLSLLLGALFDLITINQFGIMTFTILITFLFVHLLLQGIFTNKSCYSLIALGIIGNFFYTSMSVCIQIILSFLDATPLQLRLSWTLLRSFLWELFLTMLFLWIFWHIVNTLTRTFKVVFIKS